jgi:hypothetical protein
MKYSHVLVYNMKRNINKNLIFFFIYIYIYIYIHIYLLKNVIKNHMAEINNIFIIYREVDI